MKHFVGVLLCVLSVCNIAPAEYQDENGILLLGQPNFEAALSDFKYLFVNFYAQWSDTCANLEPELVKVAKKLAEENQAIRIGKVDAIAEKELADRLNIRGYPYLTFYGRGRPIEYRGIRDYPSMLRWLRKKTGPVAKKLNSVDDVKKFLDKSDISAIGFFKSNTSVAAKAFLTAALESDEASFAITYQPEVFKEYEVTEEGVILLKKFDGGRDDLFDATKLTVDGIKEFIVNNSLPVVAEFNIDNSALIFGGKMKNHLLLFMSKQSAKFAEDLDVFGKVAPRYKGRVQFVYINVDDKVNDALIEFFTIKKEQCPEMRFVSLDDDIKRYLPNVDEVTPYAIRVFVEGVLDGTIKHFLRSEDVPEGWDETPLKVLTGKNFHAVTGDKKKSVFVEFYAPWCNNSNALGPIWDDLADKYKDDDDIIIAKINGELNEVDGVHIDGFPTLKFYPKDSDQEIDYVGERTLEDLVRFLESGGVDGGYVVEKKPKKDVKDEL